jgi:very-short-patch-repair endonuclease
MVFRRGSLPSFAKWPQKQTCKGQRLRGPDTIKTDRARRLRRTDNDAETKLWSQLRDRRLGGHKFVRQVPIGNYFADFACRDCMLVVEVDGSQHAE